MNNLPDLHHPNLQKDFEAYIKDAWPELVVGLAAHQKYLDLLKEVYTEAWKAGFDTADCAAPYSGEDGE